MTGGLPLGPPTPTPTKPVVCVLSCLGFWLVFSQGSWQLASPAGLVLGFVAASSPRPWLSTGLHAPSDGGLTRLRGGRTHFWLSTGC